MKSSEQKEERILGELQKIYARRARAYDRDAAWLSLGLQQRFRNYAVQKLDLRPGQTVLDVACGTGLNSYAIQAAIGPQGRLIGLDYTAAMLEQAQKRVERWGWQNVSLIQGDVMQLDLSEKVDAILCTFAIGLLPNVHRALERMLAALRPGGRILISDFKLCGRWYSFLLNPILKRRARSWVPSVKTYFGVKPWRDLRAMGLEINFKALPRDSADYYDAFGRLHHISMKEPFFYLVRRGDVEGSLDRGLYARAQEASVQFRFNTKLDRVEGPAIVAGGPRYVDGICVGYLFATDLKDLTACILSHRLAPRGYSYLLVAEGRATLVSCHFADLPRWRDHLQATVEAFQRLFRFEMKGERFFSGYGNVFARKRFREGQKLYVGESAGLQDGLWGFGMCFAIRSGYLAAQSFLRGQDYEKLIRQELLPYHRAGLVNRFVWDLMSNRLFAYFLGRAERWPDARQRLRELSGPHPLKDLVYPFVWTARGWQVRYRDESCQREDCTCVWCTCNRQIQASQPNAHEGP